MCRCFMSETTRPMRTEPSLPWRLAYLLPHLISVTADRREIDK
jgi:hypothetical protein